MTVIFPVVELIDRLAIADVKFTRTNGANKEEFSWYVTQAESYDLELINDLYFKLVALHIMLYGSILLSLRFICTYGF